MKRHSTIHVTLPNSLKIRPNPKQTVFYVVFGLAFLLSGLITMLDIIPWRMGLASLLVIPLFLIYKFIPNKVIVAYIFLSFFIFISWLINQTSLIGLLLFYRIVIFSFLIYVIVESFVRQKNIERILHICFFVGLIQLPVLLLQRLAYSQLPSRITRTVSRTDFDFGTFNFKGDAAMTYFLLMLIIFLLFDTKRLKVIKHKIFFILWFTFTILVANAEMVKLILIIVWAVYFVINFKSRISFILFAFSLLGFISLGVMGILPTIIENAYKPLRGPILVFIQGEGIEANVNKYLEGGYSRAGAIYYYASSEILWFGDGPSIYSNSLSRERLRGNVGHIFTFYSEVGLFATCLTYLIFFLIMFTIRGWKIRLNVSRVLMFLTFIIMTFTSQVMNDISFMLIYILMSKVHLLYSQERKLVNFAYE